MDLWALINTKVLPAFPLLPVYENCWIDFIYCKAIYSLSTHYLLPIYGIDTAWRSRTKYRVGGRIVGFSYIVHRGKGERTKITGLNRINEEDLSHLIRKVL
jgi:hypothetical protein